MRPPAIITSAVATITIAIIGWNIFPKTETTSTSNSTPSTPTATVPSSVSPSSSSSKAAGLTGTFSGNTVNTRFGTVKVSVVIKDNKITDVIADKLTDVDRKSIQISNQAAPMLRQKVITAQSAKISNVSGATYTSQGYLASLQSALDTAGFKG